MHIKPFTPEDWLALALCTAVLILIFIASRPPPRYPRGSVTMDPRRYHDDTTWHVAILVGAILACVIALAVWGFMP